MGGSLSQQGEVFCFLSSLGSLTGYEAKPPPPCQHPPTHWTGPFPYHCILDRDGGRGNGSRQEYKDYSWLGARLPRSCWDQKPPG